MTFFAEKKRKIINLSKTLVLATAIFYFSYHIFSGEKGVLALIQLKQKVESAKIERDSVAEQKDSLQAKVDKLYQRSLDLDLLDEQARRVLGYAQKEEIVYLETDDTTHATTFQE